MRSLPISHQRVYLIALSKFIVKITRCGLQTVQEPKPPQAHAFVPISSLYFVIVSNFSSCISLINFCPLHLCLFTYANSIPSYHRPVKVCISSFISFSHESFLQSVSNTVILQTPSRFPNISLISLPRSIIILKP